MWDIIQKVLKIWADNQVEHVLTVRKRFTAAEINAVGGTVAVPLIVGYKYRLVDVFMISVGGAAAGATTVDLLATLSGSSRKLMASTVANLTQSAILRIGATGGTALADGASFTVNDAGTALVASKTGGSLTGSTHIDMIIKYAIERQV